MHKPRMSAAALFAVSLPLCWAHSATTTRIQDIKNDRVTVWRTTIYPGQHKILAMHRHEHDRVVLALTDGTLKVKTDQGKIHYLRFKKGHSYYLTKDVPNEQHSDQNVSHHPIKVVVVELED